MKFYCTNPKCSDPNNYSNGELSDATSIKTKFCISCGMSLLLQNKRYIALEEIGRGGFGRTFRAHDFTFNKECAIKMLLPYVPLKPSELDTAIKAFKKGSQILSTLNHEQIPRVYDFFDLSSPPSEEEPTPQKLFYLVQDYISGETLEQELSRSTFSENDVRQILHSLLGVLQYTHGQNVLHRDIKPSNIIRNNKDGKLYLIDFDAAIRRQLEPGVPVSQSIAIGTSGYAPIEQLSGRNIDSSSDLYALAATCIHLLTKKHPEEIRQTSELRERWRIFAPHVSDNLKGILDKMLMADPMERFHSATQVIEALDNTNVQTHYPPLPLTQTSPPLPPQKTSLMTYFRNIFHQITRKSRWLILPLLGLLAFMIVLGIHSFITEQPKLNDGFSNGEEALFAQNNSDEKGKGIEAFRKKDYNAAIKSFQASLKSQPNDPETRIYLNNTYAQRAKNPFQIAVSVPITKSLSTSASEILRGVAHVQSELNCGINNIKQQRCSQEGIRGRLLQVTITNDEYEDEIAKNIAETLVKSTPKILAVVGHYSSGLTRKTGNIYGNNKFQDKKLVVISPTSTAVRNPGNISTSFNQYVFRTPPTDNEAAKDLAEYVMSKNYRKVAIVQQTGSGYSKSLSEAFAEEIRGKAEIVHKCDFPGKNPRLINCVNQAARKEANVVLLALSTAKSKESLPVFSNQTDVKIIGGDGMYIPEMLEIAAQATSNEKLVISVPWHRNKGQKSDFEQQSKTLWGTESVNWRTAMSYDATKAIVHAIERQINQGKTPTRQGLYQELSSENFSVQGAAGKIEFKPDHDRKISDGIGVLVKVQPSNSNLGRPEFVRLN